MSEFGGQYDASDGNIRTALYEQIRREAFGEDIGANSRLTADELDGFLPGLRLAPGKTLLDVGCEAGGPALRSAVLTGCSVIGIDVECSGDFGSAGAGRRTQFTAARRFPRG